MKLDAIQTCHQCGGRSVIFTNNAQLYGQPYGAWPYVYLCLDCSSAVGCHYGTDKPLGRMANKATRQARRQAHEYFDALWRNGRMSRSNAYAWLADQMGVPKGQCHIGNFTVAQCRHVIELVKALEGNP